MMVFPLMYTKLKSVASPFNPLVAAAYSTHNKNKVINKLSKTYGYTKHIPMSSLIRKSISEKIGKLINNNNVFYELEVPLKPAASGKPVLQWCLKNDTAANGELLKEIENLDFDKELVNGAKIVSGNGKSACRIEFDLNERPFMESLLRGVDRENLNKHHQHMVFEYSSPNIAKPFHVGHLRSTIIGNMLANLHDSLGYSTTKMNYLGDWGTQFGMLQVGVEILQVNEQQMQENPIETLYKAYVAANRESEKDSSIAEKARNHFRDLESGKQSQVITQQWQKYREYTIKNLEAVYKRLGVSFDVYDWESQYNQKQISQVIQQLTNKNILLADKDGRKIVEIDKRRVPVIKSDGTTLYLARDIAALLDRWQRFRFENIFYVVENGQTDHFKACFHTTSKLHDEIKESKLKHVKFGRIHGMSTRKGQAVFLKDLLDEARDIMHEKQLTSPTTKVDITSVEVADVLGVSAVIINDLKQRRQRDYEFSWNKALQTNGDTGVKLQYTHCRLNNLMEQNCNIDTSNLQFSPKLLKDPEAYQLLNEIARFPQILWQAKEQLEACVLVNYLFALSNCTSRALKCLPVKAESDLEKQKHRLLLFQTAKKVLKQGMEILGLKPLNKM